MAKRNTGWVVAVIVAISVAISALSPKGKPKVDLFAWSLVLIVLFYAFKYLWPVLLIAGLGRFGYQLYRAKKAQKTGQAMPKKQP